MLSFFKHASMSAVHLFSLSTGSLTSIATESSSKPRKVITCLGCTVLSGAIGILMSAHMDRSFPRARREFGTSIAPCHWDVWMPFSRGECMVISLDDH